MAKTQAPPNTMGLEEIAESFLSKERDVIIRALQHMMFIQAGRLEMGLRNERDDGLLSSKTSALMNSMFSNAIKIAKLVDPRDTDRALIQINTQVNTTSNELVSRAFTELERAGYQREAITTELVEQHIAGQLLEGPPRGDS